MSLISAVMLFVAAWLCSVVGLFIASTFSGADVFYSGVPLFTKWIVTSSVILGLLIGLTESSVRSHRKRNYIIVSCDFFFAFLFVFLAGTVGRLFEMLLVGDDVNKINWSGVVFASTIYAVILLPLSLPVVFITRGVSTNIIGYRTR